MTRPTTIDEQALTGGERRYLSEAKRVLRHLPEHDRTRLLAELRLHLEERPSDMASYDALVDELGPPDDYGRHLLAEHRLTPPPPRPWWIRWLAGAATVATLASGAFLWRYFTVEPHLSNACGGLTADGTESVTAAGVTEYTAPFRAGGRFGVAVCFFVDESARDLTILGVHTADDGGSLAFVGTEGPPSEPILHVGDASAFHPFKPTDDAIGRLGYPTLMMWFEMRGCSHGGGLNLIYLDYRWRGRTRTMMYPLGHTYTVESAECTGAEWAEWDGMRERFHDELWHQPGADQALRDADPDPGLGREVSLDAIGHDLCRHLWGIKPLTEGIGATMNQFEPLGERAVFQLPDRELAEAIIVAATEGMCPEFAGRQDELVALLG